MVEQTYIAKAYLILERDYHGMKIADMRKNKPSLRSGQVAVRVQIKINSTLFENLIPTISAEIQAADIIEPTVEVLPAELDEP